MALPQRPFNPETLKPYALPEIQPILGAGTILVWRYTVLVPVEEIRADGSVREVATLEDLDSLEGMLADHFGGVTAPTTVPGLKGFGARDPAQPQPTREVNRHASFMVYAAARGASDAYFLALRRELEGALCREIGDAPDSPKDKPARPQSRREHGGSRKEEPAG